MKKLLSVLLAVLLFSCCMATARLPRRRKTALPLLTLPG